MSTTPTVDGDITQQELLETLRTRFGANPADWAFQCPSCKDIATAGDFAQALKDHPRIDRNGDPVTAGTILGQECIGRTLGALLAPAGKYEGRGCDWVAYGLIPGPLAVLMPNGNVARSFPIAPAAEPAANRVEP